MSRLSKLYQAMETLASEGLELSAEQEAQLRKAEEDLIRQEILPTLIEKIEPALSSVERELVLVVDYVPKQPLSVRISRKRNFVNEIPDAKVIALDPEVEHTQRSQISTPITRGNSTKLSVKFSDGTVIAETKATETFVKAVHKIGVMKVRAIVERENIVFCRVPVISNRRDSKYGKAQKDLGNGWLLMTHSNNLMKKTFLDTISNALNLGLVVSVEQE